MSFNKSLPKQLAELRVKYTNLRFKKIDMFHDCGCEYCDYDGILDDFTEEDVDNIEKEMLELSNSFVRIKKYAEDNNIDVSENIIHSFEAEIRANKNGK